MPVNTKEEKIFQINLCSLSLYGKMTVHLAFHIQLAVPSGFEIIKLKLYMRTNQT